MSMYETNFETVSYMYIHNLCIKSLHIHIKFVVYDC